MSFRIRVPVKRHVFKNQGTGNLFVLTLCRGMNQGLRRAVFEPLGLHEHVFLVFAFASFDLCTHITSTETMISGVLNTHLLFTHEQ
jgi:hypothetical protein